MRCPCLPPTSSPTVTGPYSTCARDCRFEDARGRSITLGPGSVLCGCVGRRGTAVDAVVVMVVSGVGVGSGGVRGRVRAKVVVRDCGCWCDLSEMNEFAKTLKGRMGPPLVAGDDSGSFDRFYAAEYRAVLGLAFVLTGDRRLAEDLTQDAFLSAWSSWAEVDNPSGWIRSVVSNKARSSWRRRFASRRALEALSAATPTAPTLSEDTLGFWEQVRGLPKRQAQVVALFYLDDLPVGEIAQLLGCAESTARKHLSRGRRNLASRLGVQP